jgi:hypothetical protein
VSRPSRRRRDGAKAAGAVRRSGCGSDPGTALAAAAAASDSAHSGRYEFCPPSSRPAGSGAAPEPLRGEEPPRPRRSGPLVRSLHPIGGRPPQGVRGGLPPPLIIGGLRSSRPPRSAARHWRRRSSTPPGATPPISRNPRERGRRQAEGSPARGAGAEPLKKPERGKILPRSFQSVMLCSRSSTAFLRPSSVSCPGSASRS